MGNRTHVHYIIAARTVRNRLTVREPRNLYRAAEGQPGDDLGSRCRGVLTAVGMVETVDATFFSVFPREKSVHVWIPGTSDILIVYLEREVSL
jgi:hypothetical protein